jgi:hypothetical protein
VAIDPLMPWVRFLENFDWMPDNARWMMVFRKGKILLVKQEVADKAIAQGKAVPSSKQEMQTLRDRQINASG